MMRPIDWLLTRAPRERLLLGLLVALVLPAALGFGWLLPLEDRRRAAEAALEEAQALNAWVRHRQAEMAGLASAAPVPGGAPVGASLLEQSLVSVRLRERLTALESGGDGGIALRFEAVGFTDLMRWIDGQVPGWGYEIASLRLEPTDRPAQVAARLVLVPVE